MNKRKRADGLDPRSRAARRANGVVRLEIELPIPDAEALAELAKTRDISRGQIILHLLRFGTLPPDERGKS